MQDQEGGRAVVDRQRLTKMMLFVVRRRRPRCDPDNVNVVSWGAARTVP